MEFIDLNKDITRQVRFYEHIASFMVAEADADDDDEDVKSLDAHGCGDCVSFTIFAPDNETSILINKDDARKLGEFLIATANL